MGYELREYRVKAGEMEDWLKEWKAKIRPLREKFRFKIVGAWTMAKQNRFVWILRFDGSMKSFEDADKAYYNSSERKSLTPNPARHLEGTETWKMESVLP